MSKYRPPWTPTDRIRDAIVEALAAESIDMDEAALIADQVIRLVAEYKDSEAHGSMVRDPGTSARIVRCLIAEPTLSPEHFESAPEDLVAMIEFVRRAADPSMTLEHVATQLESMVKPGRPIAIRRDLLVQDLVLVLGYAFRDDIWAERRVDPNPEVIQVICGVIELVLRNARIKTPASGAGANAASQQRMNREVRHWLGLLREQIKLVGDDANKKRHKSRVLPEVS